MRERLKNYTRDLPLGVKIRYSYIIVIAPLVIFMALSLFILWQQNARYDRMLDAAGNASRFSLDFKSEFDYETYLVIVESKSFEDSELRNMLSEASEVIDSLASESDLKPDNVKRLEDIRKYLKNLSTYTDRIEKNLKVGDKYEENIEIWENDIQIVTALIRESMIQFIYYEIKDIQTARSEIQQLYRVVLYVGIISAVIIFIVVVRISYVVSASITEPISKLSKVTEQVAEGNLNVRANIDTGAELGLLGKSLDEMIEQISILLDRVRDEEESLRKTELELLQAQINPHFLYNTLDTIVWLAEGGDQEKVVSMVGSLSDFFRTSLGQGKDVVTVKDEIKHVVSYLEIQQVRYQDILDYSVDIPEEIHDCLIPKITIQPLVENALYHGIKNKRGKGLITVTGVRENSNIFIYVTDNGMGMTKERLDQISDKINKVSDEDDIFGLNNINERIRLKFGSRYGIHIESVYGEGTTASVMLPYDPD